jgi:hypothetical protein
MSTLQHITQPVFRTRLALVVLAAATLAAVTVTLIIAAAGSSTPAAPSVSPQKQLEAVSGARYGITRVGAEARQAPEQQLQAVAGARYHQPIGR